MTETTEPQLSLLDHENAPGSRRSDPETSKAAAAAQTPTKVRASHARVLAMFRLYGDMYDAQLMDVLRSAERDAGLSKLMSPSGVRSRRNELVKLGKIQDTGRRELVDGHQTIVWGLVERAR